ncbi:MAG: hypothetical protein Q7R83_03975, partial [bacterium]|nr:hypothetical protein [bacterium]
MEDKKALFSTEKPGWRETLGALPFAIRLIRDVQPSLFYFLLVLSLLQGPLSFLSVYAIKRTTDALSFGLFSAGFFWAIAIAVVQEVSSIITTLRESGMDRQRFKLEMALEEKAIKHFSTLSYRTLEDPDFQTLAMAYERKTYVILNLQTNGTRIVQNIISLVGLTTGLIFIPWSAALFPILALAATAYLLVRYSNWSWDVLSHETRQGRRARYYSDLLKRPAAILPVKALSLIDPFTRRWRKLVDAVLQSKLRQNTKSFGIFILGGALEVAGLACGLLLL